ncbi:DinB family protein [Granulicella tundricola]|uniref:DinB-like domain-containing protein n=1 Tax=Granulicella tundricola (strain ATCC BAA-1859 / DSM 23138 / MP5ACTX9) TaxID=1198114 RepID=E8X1W7_GRATM|nr:DinB family protein [Granulicella tundricola]ADW69128.1 hypothetical protein AciX9_2084 [Granulicella tundricola MP5ACTX9]
MVEAITPSERQLVLDQLSTSEQRLLELATNLNPSQWHFQESPDRWSIAEIIEHCIVFERFITGVITNALATPATTEKKPEAPTKEPWVQGLAQSRHTRFKSREVNLPTGRWPNPIDLIAELRQTRAQTLHFASETQSPLRDHFFPHIAFGDLDCYQWLVVTAQHTARHAHQIEEIKSNPAYPPS